MADSEISDTKLLRDLAAQSAEIGAELLRAQGRDPGTTPWHFEPLERVREGVYRRRGVGFVDGYVVSFDMFDTSVDSDWPSARHGGMRIGEGSSAVIRSNMLPGDVGVRFGVTGSAAPRLFVKNVNIDAQTPITTTGLRAVKIPELVSIIFDVAYWQPHDPPLAQRERQRRGRGRIYGDDELADIAAVAKANPQRRFAAVVDQFHLPRSTAADYINRAREAGHDVGD